MRLVAATNSLVIPGSWDEWPASGTITMSASGQTAWILVGSFPLSNAILHHPHSKPAQPNELKVLPTRDASKERPPVTE
jgi:hypothetical protein